MIRAVMLFLVTAALVTAAAGWVLLLIYPGTSGQQAILTSAAISLVVQLVAFIVLRSFKGKNVIAGWGIGALLRFAALGLYAVFSHSVLGLDMNTALVSLACFLFLSMLIEPLLINV
jgi:hypothetical protein